MFGWKRKTIASDAEIVSVGITVDDESVTVVALDGEVDGRPNVVAWESLPFTSIGELQNRLERFVGSHNLKGRSCRCALSPSAYCLRLVERPANVPDNELVDATRWLIRDLIEFDLESAPLAVIKVPGDSARMRTPHMFVVAAQYQPTFDLGHVIAASGLTLAGFEIDESAMLALDRLMPTNVAGCAAIRLTDKSSVLTLSHGDNLYLARNLHTDLYAIDAAADQALREENPAGPAIIECLDPLLLDIQRSFDYYESEYGKAPASRLTLLPGSVDLTPLVPALREALRPVQVESFELERFFAFPETPSADLHLRLSIALGAAIAPAALIGDALIPSVLRTSTGGSDWLRSRVSLQRSSWYSPPTTASRSISSPRRASTLRSSKGNKPRSLNPSRPIKNRPR